MESHHKTWNPRVTLCVCVCVCVCVHLQLVNILLQSKRDCNGEQLINDFVRNPSERLKSWPSEEMGIREKETEYRKLISDAQ